MKEYINHGPFVFPEISCPFPSLISPHLEQVQEQAHQWVHEMGLIQKETALRYYLAADFPQCACRMFPRAGLEELFLCCDWFFWVFVFDDQFDDGTCGREPASMRAIYDRLLLLLDTPARSIPQGPAATALLDTWQRACRLMPSLIWQKRFAQHHASFFAACCQDATYRAQQQIPDVVSYVNNRAEAAACPINADLLALTRHLEIPEETSPLFQMVLQASYNIVAWTNDIYALEKELAHGEVNNLVVVLSHAQSCSLQEAIDRAVTMVESETQRFEQLVEDLLASAWANTQKGCNLHQYMIDTGSLIRGHLEWELRSLRYREVEYTEPGKSSSYLEEILPEV